MTSSDAISDLESAYNPVVIFKHEINRYIQLNIPQVSLYSVPKAPSRADEGKIFTTTKRYTMATPGLAQDGGARAEVCLNHDATSLVARCDWLIAGLALGSYFTTEYDIQIALDPNVFDKPEHRVVWNKTSRRAVEDRCVNFYSSRIAGHSRESNAGLTYKLLIPSEVARSLYFDFACRPYRDITGAALRSPGTEASGRVREKSAVEMNLRAMPIYIRCFARLKFSDQVIVLRSDLAPSIMSLGANTSLGRERIGEFVRVWLLGYFQIRSRLRERQPARQFGRQTFTPQAVVIHVVSDSRSFTRNEDYLFGSSTPAHYLIGHEGQITQFVEEVNVAQHAGYVSLNRRPLPPPDSIETVWRTYERNGHYVRPKGAKKSKWVKEKTVISPNEDTIGIEHQGEAATPWGLKKYAACAWLLQDMYTRWPDLELSNARIVPHNLFTGRDKQCPGTTVDLNTLIEMAIGYRERQKVDSEAPLYVP